MNYLRVCARFGILLLTASLWLVAMTGCEDDTEPRVRFENNSPSRTVYAVFDGMRMETLQPGQKTGYIKVGKGFHTVQWFDARTNRPVTSVAWPNLSSGYHTFPYP